MIDMIGLYRLSAFQFSCEIVLVDSISPVCAGQKTMPQKPYPPAGKRLFIFADLLKLDEG